MRGLLERLRAWVRLLLEEVIVLWLAARDVRVPWYAKLLAGAVAAYALSPIDLIPDVIPVIGLLDDLLLVPAGIWASLRLIPADVLTELRARAREAPLRLPASRWAAAVVIGVWVLLAVWLVVALGV